MIITKMDSEFEVGVKLGALSEGDIVLEDSEVSLVGVSDSGRVSEGNDEGFGSQTSPRSKEITLEHSRTAPASANAYSKIFAGNPEIILPRSRTEKRAPLQLDLQIDRLPDSEKRKLIENLVKVHNDGTIDVDMGRSVSVVSELLELDFVDTQSTNIEDVALGIRKSVPRMKIAILVVGTRGDVQPFLAIAKRLQEYGHQVRLATHSNFCTFVKSAGVNFYPLGGDPRVLAGYMARNKGLLPSGPAELYGLPEQRKQLKAIIDSLLPACTAPDLETGAPFRAQAIIANPPAYGHAHVAEALSIPLHIIFTMPWTPTNEFPHPLARVSQTAGYKLSYFVVDLIIWWSIRGLINDFRKSKLKLPPIAYFNTYRGSISHFPTGYLWSPRLVPKPRDWGPLVDVVGFCFLNLGSKFDPPKELLEWLENGSKPVYIGFGSMPLEDGKKTTTTILEALHSTGQRGIIDKGWGDLGCLAECSDEVYLLENCPHDWLFPHCNAVVHHGGAGTTATGLKAGCPTIIVPFFGDQFFWGERVHERGVGPEPIPISQLTSEKLSAAIRFALDVEVKSRAMELAIQIENEDGVAGAVEAFHNHLPAELPTPHEPPIDLPSEPSLWEWLLKFMEKWCCLPS